MELLGVFLWHRLILLWSTTSIKCVKHSWDRHLIRCRETRISVAGGGQLRDAVVSG